MWRTFTRYLIRVDDGAAEGERLLRRVVPRASPRNQQIVRIRRLVDAGLLVTKDATIELAHERLINNWPNLPLTKWLDEDAIDAGLLDRTPGEREKDDTLSDALLGQAEGLLQRDLELATEELAPRELVQRSRDQRIEAEIQHERTRAQLLEPAGAPSDRRGIPDDIERGGALALRASYQRARSTDLPRQTPSRPLEAP